MKIDQNCLDPAQLTQQRLLSLYNAKGLRLAENLVAFLVKTLEIQWDNKITIADSANKRTQETIASTAGQPWSDELEEFQKYLQTKELSSRTIRSYITAATALLWHARVERTSDLIQRHVNGWLQLRRGRANDLLSFTTWLRASRGAELEVRGRPLNTPRKREKKILAISKLLINRLMTCRTERQMKAILARAIAIVYSVRLEELLGLHSDEITIVAKGVRAEIKGKTIELTEPFAELLLKFRQPGLRMFSGRAGFKPLSVDVTRYHVRNISRKSARS